VDQAERVLAKLKAKAAAEAAAATAPQEKPRGGQPSAFVMRENWEKALLASSESLAVKVVAWRIAKFFNVASGRCDPSYEGIVRDLGGTMSKRTVMRSVARLEETGWVGVQRSMNGRGRTNRLTLLLPKNPAANNEDAGE
jgi:hypothetical protein